jgi:hypothetical protein
LRGQLDVLGGYGGGLFVFWMLGWLVSSPA